MKNEKVILALEEENDIVLVNINNALHNNQDIEAINFTKLLKENIDLIHNLKAELPSWGTLPKVEDCFSNSEEIIQNLKDKANKDTSKIPIDLTKRLKEYGKLDVNIIAREAHKAKYWCEEAFEKDKLIQEVNEIITDTFENNNDYKEILGIIYLRINGYSVKEIEELKDCNNISKLTEKINITDGLGDSEEFNNMVKNECMTYENKTLCPKTKETELKNIHNIEIIDDYISLDCTIKNDDTTKDEDVTIQVPKMILKGNIVTKNITATSKTMKIDLEIECLNTISENGDNILATMSYIVK